MARSRGAGVLRFPVLGPMVCAPSDNFRVKAIMVRALTTPPRLNVWPWGFVPTAFAFLYLLVGCAAERPALTVGDVAFASTQLVAVPESALESLVAATALAVATRDDEIIERATTLRARAAVEALANAAMREVTLSAAGVGDDQLSARYETAPAHELDVRHIVFLAERTLPDAQRLGARTNAEAALKRARTGEDFTTLAAELSEEPGAAERGGLLQPGREGSWVDEFWSAAQLLAPGQVSPVVESVFGYHVLKLEARRIIPFERVRDRVAAEVAELLPTGAATAFVDSVRAEIALEPAGGDVVARWSGGELTESGLRTFLAGGAASEFRAAMGIGPERARIVEDVAVTMALSRFAEGQGLTTDGRYVDQVLQDFQVQARGWAAILGLTGAASPEAIAERALAGLHLTGQNATIARRELQDRAPLFATFYPISDFRAGATTETAGSGAP
jgi:hypothetical protein